jgi:F-type H+-transporting ATPase subunit gamma
MRRRIRTVRNTQQITKAMKMISAARLRKSQERAFNARPYAGLLRETLAGIASRSQGLKHPLLVERPQERITVLVLTGDRGLCGAFNTNILRAVERFLTEHSDKQITVVPIGRKGRDYVRRRGLNVEQEYTGIYAKLDYSNAKTIAAQLIADYTEAKTDAVYVIYNEFKSVISQKLTVAQLLPLQSLSAAGESADGSTSAEGSVQIDYIYEQPPQEMLDTLLPRNVEVQIYGALLESIAAEHAARMTAMDAATSSAGDMIDSLTLTMNRIRQAAITKEIIEIVSGAAAI